MWCGGVGEKLKCDGDEVAMWWGDSGVHFARRMSRMQEWQEHYEGGCGDGRGA